MPGSERIVLDPSAVATNRTELDITQYVALDGIDFGNAEIQQFMADGAYGSVPVDFRVPARTVTIPLRLQARGTVTFDQIRNNIQSKVARIQQDGFGWVGRVTSNGGTVFADVTNATLHLGGGWGQARGGYDENAQLTLECLPDWYGAEAEASAVHDESTLPELVWTETGTEGDYPGRVRLVVTDRQGQDQLGLLWGFRCRHYSSASTARLAYEAEALTPLGAAATAVGTSPASGGGSNVVSLSNVPPAWTPVLNTNLLAGTYLTHTGTYRVWARVRCATSVAPVVQLRFVWDVGDLTNPTENAPWTYPTALNYFLADLGEIRLDATTGTHRWQGQIQARSDSGSQSVQIDRLFFQPLDEGAGRLRSPIAFTPGLSSIAANDQFNQTAGNLAGKTLPQGGTWVAVAGDADDFAVETTGLTAQRTAVSDTTTSGFGGRGAIAGTSTFTDAFAQVDFKTSAFSAGSRGVQGLLLRHTDLSNTLRCAFEVGQTGPFLRAVKIVAGSETELGFAECPTLTASTWYTLTAVVRATGTGFISIARAGGGNFASATFQDSALATGGTLASGKSGFFDYRPSADAGTRNYDNFSAGTPVPDAVIFANRSVQLTTAGVFREDSTGTAYGPVSEVIGDLPRLPVAGLEGRTVEVFVKTSRGDLDQLPDSAIDDVRGQNAHQPSFLYIDETGS